MTFEMEPDMAAIALKNYLSNLWHTHFWRIDEGDIHIIVTDDKKGADTMEEAYNQYASDSEGLHNETN